MLSGISFWTADPIWRHILTELGAEHVARADADVIFSPNKKMPPVEIKREFLRLAHAREDEILKSSCGGAKLSDSQKKIIIAIRKRGEISADELQRMLGYSSDASTNAINTAIYQLRKIFGKEFIKNKGGKYKL